MWFLIGVAAGIVFCFATDDWRVRMLLSRGYDNAVRDILEYGYYYSNERVEPPQLDESLLYKVGYWWGEIGVPEK